MIICQRKPANFFFAFSLFLISFFFFFLQTKHMRILQPLFFFALSNPFYVFLDLVTYTIALQILKCTLLYGSVLRNSCKYTNMNRHLKTICDSTQSSFPTPKLICMHALRIYIGMGRNGTIHTFLKSNKFAQLGWFCK